MHEERKKYKHVHFAGKPKHLMPPKDERNETEQKFVDNEVNNTKWRNKIFS